MVATMDVYGYSLTDGQASVAAIWIGNDVGDNSDLDSIAVGWEVSCCPLTSSSFPSVLLLYDHTLEKILAFNN